MFCSPRSQKHKKPQQPTKTSPGASKLHSTAAVSSKPRPPAKPTTAGRAKPPIANKPAKHSSSTTANVKHVSATQSENIGSFLGMKEYMDAMDRELARTNVGKSFVRDGDDEVGSLCIICVTFTSSLLVTKSYSSFAVYAVHTQSS